jgi:hypothetical protein
MREMGLQGVVRGKKVITTNPFAMALGPMALPRLTLAALPGRQGQPRLPCRAAEPAVGRAIVRHWFENTGERLHACSDLVRDRLVRGLSRPQRGHGLLAPWEIDTTMPSPRA